MYTITLLTKLETYMWDRLDLCAHSTRMFQSFCLTWGMFTTCCPTAWHWWCSSCVAWGQLLKDFTWLLMFGIFTHCYRPVCLQSWYLLSVTFCEGQTYAQQKSVVTNATYTQNDHLKAPIHVIFFYPLPNWTRTVKVKSNQETRFLITILNIICLCILRYK